jgi:hypothetical protein
MPRPSSRSGRNTRETSGRPSLVAIWTSFNERLAEKRADAPFEPDHIEPGRRIIALGIDFGIGFLLALMVMMIPFINRYLDIKLVIILFLLFRDYFFEGRGFGKNLMGFAVFDIFTGEAPNLKQVFTRNFIYLGPILISQIVALVLMVAGGLIPIPALNAIFTTINKVVSLIATLYVLVILPLESYRSYEREDSMRLGDEIAGTCLGNTEMNFSNFLSK